MPRFPDRIDRSTSLVRAPDQSAPDPSNANHSVGGSAGGSQPRPVGVSLDHQSGEAGGLSAPLPLSPPVLDQGRRPDRSVDRSAGQRFIDGLKEAFDKLKTSQGKLNAAIGVFKVAAAALGVIAALATGPAGIALASIGLVIVALHATGLLEKAIGSVDNRGLKLVMTIGVALLLAASSMHGGGGSAAVTQLGKGISVASVAGGVAVAAGGAEEFSCMVTDTATAVNKRVVAVERHLAGQLKGADAADNQAGSGPVDGNKANAAQKIQDAEQNLLSKDKWARFASVFKVAAAAAALVAAVATGPVLPIVAACMLLAVALLQETGATAKLMEWLGAKGGAVALGVAVVAGCVVGGGLKEVSDLVEDVTLDGIKAMVSAAATSLETGGQAGEALVEAVRNVQIAEQQLREARDMAEQLKVAGSASGSA
jgi:hypothetical protein